MTLRIARGAAALPPLSAACIPDLESRRVENPYPPAGFTGPDTLPPAPSGTVEAMDPQGPWRVPSVVHEDGASTIEHLCQPGWFLLVTGGSVTSLQGVPPEWMLPPGSDWHLNRVDRRGVALGFGFATRRGTLSFLHYAFVGAALSANHMEAVEAVHF